jgi:Methylamine utilisation protein MauE
MPEATRLLAALFAVLFIGSGVSKVDGYPGWVGLVARLPLPARARGYVALGLPVLEVVVGVFTIIAPRLGLVVCALLLAGFSAYLTAVMPRVRDVECNCFGPVASMRIGPRLVFRNAGLAIVAGVTAALSWPETPRPVPVLEFASLALLAIVSVVVVEFRSLPKVESVGLLVPEERKP